MAQDETGSDPVHGFQYTRPHAPPSAVCTPLVTPLAPRPHPLAKELVLFRVAAPHPSRPQCSRMPLQSTSRCTSHSILRHVFASHCLLLITPPLICLLPYLSPVALGITSWQVTSNCPAIEHAFLSVLGPSEVSGTGARRGIWSLQTHVCILLVQCQVVSSPQVVVRHFRPKIPTAPISRPVKTDLAVVPTQRIIGPGMREPKFPTAPISRPAKTDIAVVPTQRIIGPGSR